MSWADEDLSFDMWDDIEEYDELDDIEDSWRPEDTLDDADDAFMASYWNAHGFRCPDWCPGHAV